jgi:multidrug efflux system membrane fusion protein
MEHRVPFAGGRQMTDAVGGLAQQGRRGSSRLSRWLMLILGAAVLLAAYVGVRTAMQDRDGIATVRAETVPTLGKPVSDGRAARDGMPVAVLRSVAEVRPLFVSLTGRTEAIRTFTAEAETGGAVRQAPAVEGRMVAKGDLLCGLDVEGRGARVREAEAARTKRQIEYDQAVKLAEGGWATEPRVAGAKATLDAADAALAVARAELAKTQIRAPFAGVFEKRLADVGDFLGPGDACGTLVQLDPITVVAEAPERSAEGIRPGAGVRARLSDGEDVTGAVRYIAKTSDPTTRAYRVEIELANPNGQIPVGRATEVRIQIGEGDAHRVDPALLTLDGEGRIGLRYLDVGGMVSFVPADVVDESPQGLWISGLPREALIVAEGQPEVKPGLRATPVLREAAAAAPAPPPSSPSPPATPATDTAPATP